MKRTITFQLSNLKTKEVKVKQSVLDTDVLAYLKKIDIERYRSLIERLGIRK